MSIRWRGKLVLDEGNPECLTAFTILFVCSRQLHGRIRELESELLLKNRSLADLRAQFNETLSGSASRHKRTNSSSRAGTGRPTTTGGATSATATNRSRLKATTSRVAAPKTTTQRVTIQMLQREVDDLKWKLTKASGSREATEAMASSTIATPDRDSISLALSRRNLLMKLIDLYVEKQQQHRQSTFLTQSAPSDVLISTALVFEPYERDSLDLSDCSIDDDDLRELLLKVQVSGVSFREIHLDPVSLSDIGAQHIASFLEKCPPSVKVLNLDGDAPSITHHGVETIKHGLLRNSAVHRVEASDQVIDALVAQDEFEIHGRPTIVLRVFLPSTRHCDGSHHATRASDEEVGHMVDRVNQMGFSDLFARSNAFTPAAFSIYTASASSAGKVKRTSVASGIEGISVGGERSLSSTRQHSLRRQQSEKQRRLEMAIERATTPATSAATSGGHSQNAPACIGLARSRSSSQIPARSGVSVSLAQSFSSSRLALRSASSREFRSGPSMYSNAHLATMRGLKR